MENLPNEGRAIRIFEKASPGDGWTFFVVTQDDILVETKDAPSLQPPSTILIYEYPLTLPFGTAYPVTLSATHLVRSVNNRKPFKRRIVEIAGSYPLSADFDLTQLPASAQREDIATVLPGAQGLLLGGPVCTTNTVPTRPKEVPVYGLGMALDQGRTLPLLPLFHELPDTSLTMLPQAATEDTYMLGHLFSLMGVPTLVLPENPRHHSPVVELFFNAYGKKPLKEALLTALQNPQSKGERWISLGYWGMTEEEALDLATASFQILRPGGYRLFQEKRTALCPDLF